MECSSFEHVSPPWWQAMHSQIPCFCILFFVLGSDTHSSLGNILLLLSQPKYFYFSKCLVSSCPHLVREGVSGMFSHPHSPARRSQPSSGTLLSVRLLPTSSSAFISCSLPF